MERLWDLETHEAGQGTGLWLERGSPLLGTPGLCPAPDQAHWEEEICLCQVVSSGPERGKDGRDDINSSMPQATLFND